MPGSHFIAEMQVPRDTDTGQVDLAVIGQGLGPYFAGALIAWHTYRAMKVRRKAQEANHGQSHPA